MPNCPLLGTPREPVITKYPLPNVAIVRPQLVEQGCDYTRSLPRFLSQLCYRFCISGEQRLAFVLWDLVLFAPLFLLVGRIIIFFDFLVIFLSSKDDTPAYTPAARRPFWQLSSLMQQLHISGPPLGQAFQAVSMGVTIYFSR